MLPKQDLPREKLIKFGVSSLSDLELIALILGSGFKNNDVISLASNLLTHSGGLKKISDLALGELISIKGMKIAKATKILAISEISRRINQRETLKKTSLKTPQEIYNYLKERLEHEAQEQFFLMILNTKYHLIQVVKLFVGSLDLHLIHPRDIFREAVKNNAKYIICAHNHPSGDTTPSKQDIETTKSIEQLGLMLGIKLLDHLIISQHSFTSLKAENYF
jgi:DNA repair protein RadC